MALKLSLDSGVVAAASGLVHNASLIHDDLQDRDTMRRGVATINGQLMVTGTI
jgi:geranylgeranyl pyrophosphate synthase